MKFKEFLPYLNNEEKAEEYLREARILKKFETCIYCNSGSLRKIRRGKIKCYSCKKEWNIMKGSIIERSRLDYSIIIMIIKLYSMGLSIFMISNETSKSKLSISPIIYEIRSKIKNKVDIKIDNSSLILLYSLVKN